MLSTPRSSIRRSRLVRSGRFAFLILILVGLAATLNACASNDVVANPLVIPAERFPVAFKQAGLELRESGFIVDRQDLRNGLITSRPRSSPTIFEPWYDTNTTFEQVASSTVDSQRRIVRVSIEPSAPIPATIVNVDPAATQPSETASTEPTTAPGPDAYKDYPPYLIRVEVFVERLERPTNQMYGSAYNGIFNNLRDVPTDLRQRGIVGTYWQPIGRDSYLEQRILARLIKRMNDLDQQ